MFAIPAICPEGKYFFDTSLGGDLWHLKSCIMTVKEEKEPHLILIFQQQICLLFCAGEIQMSPKCCCDWGLINMDDLRNYQSDPSVLWWRVGLPT